MCPLVGRPELAISGSWRFLHVLIDSCCDSEMTLYITDACLTYDEHNIEWSNADGSGNHEPLAFDSDK